MKTAMAVQLQSNPVWSGADYWPELGRVVEQFIGQPCAPNCASDEAADLASVQVEQLLLRLLAELAGQPTTPAGLPAMLARYQALFAASPRPCFLVAQEIKA